MAWQARKGERQSTLDMTKGNPYTVMIRFALPILLSQVFQQLYNTADTLIVGRFLGTDALAAVSASGNLIFLMISFFMGMSTGAGVVIARYFGAGDHEKVQRAISTNLAFGIATGVLLTVVGVVFTPTLLRWMQTDPEVMPQAVEYFRYYYAGAIAMVLYNTCIGIMNAVGDSKRPLYYLILSSIINVILDLLFVGGFGWGVWSAAVATVISQAISAVLCLMHLSGRHFAFPVQWRKLRFHWDMLQEIVRYGLPSGIQNSVIAIANVIVQSQINSFGKLATAAYGTYSKLEGFGFLPINSFAMAISPFISQNLGAREYERAKRGGRFGILAAMVLAQAVGILFYIMAPELIGLFDGNPGVIELGVRQARIATMFYGILAFSHAVAAVCRGAGKAFVPMAVMLSVWCVLRIIYIAIMMRLVGEIQMIYWAYPITWSITFVIFLIYYLTSDWVHGFEKKTA